MRPTVDYIKKCFQEYNNTFFNGALPMPPIELSNSKSFMGQLMFRKRFSLFRQVQLTDFRLRISTRFDYDEQELQDTVIHEMIHYYIGLNQIKDTSSHGRIFRQMMNSINQQYGRHITISHKLTKDDNLTLLPPKSTLRIFVIVRMTDEQLYIKSVPKNGNKIREMNSRLIATSEVKSVEWYYSTDSFFCMYPVSMSNRFHRISDVELQPHLLNAKKMAI